MRATMDSQLQDCVILILTLFAFCQLTEMKYLCEFEENFSSQGKQKCFKHGVSVKDKASNLSSPKPTQLANTPTFGYNSDEAHTSKAPCPPNMIFGNCTCTGTCADPTAQSTCNSICAEVEGCICPPEGFLMDGDQCIPINECACFIPETGKVLVVNALYIDYNCSRRCVCEDDALVCEDDYQCSPYAVCEERSNLRQCYCKDGFIGDGQTCSVPTDCLDIFNAGFTDSGIYTIKPSSWSGSSFEVYCNMTDGGGWTVFQRRVNGSVDFYLDWEDYKGGFGFLEHEFWLGNDKIAVLTNQKHYQLRIDFVNRLGSLYYATYNLFRMANEDDNYKLTELGAYDGTAGSDALNYHRGAAFTTRDRDNDEPASINCAHNCHGAWWYKNCLYSNLNGGYFESGSKSIRWHELPGGSDNIQYTEMKIRPT